MRSALLALILTSLVFDQSAFGQRAVPVDNEQVRVVSVVDQPGRKTAMHEHTMNRVMIYLDAGVQRISYEDGRVSELKVTPGQAIWNPAGGRHTSENVGGKPYRIVEVELKGQPKPFEATALDPLRVYPSGYKVEIDNPQVRVVRARIPAGQKVPLHEHALNRVNVFLQPQKMVVTPEGGSPTELSVSQGEVRFAPPAKHVEENKGDGVFEVLFVELK